MIATRSPNPMIAAIFGFLGVAFGAFGAHGVDGVQAKAWINCKYFSGDHKGDMLHILYGGSNKYP